jgi:hypothetical protein
MILRKKDEAYVLYRKLSPKKMTSFSLSLYKGWITSNLKNPTDGKVLSALTLSEVEGERLAEKFL